MISGAALTRAIARYEQELADYATRNVSNEEGVRSAFKGLLDACTPTGWLLILEDRLANGVKPDGTMRDDYNLRRGYWEAKDTHDDLETEIKKKLAKGYPTSNIIFEDTRRAVLYQGGRRNDFDLRKRSDVIALLTAFIDYQEPEVEGFHQAVAEFGEHIPDLATGLKQRIEAERAANNQQFKTAWASFYTLCKTTLDPNIRAETVDDMLVQHLLTERLFRTVFDNPDFLRRNVIAVEIEQVIAALTSRAFNRNDFLRALDRFYVAIENEARGLTDWSEKQGFMNTVYERFFQNWSKRQADTHGIVYTPQPIVDFMCASVEEVLRRDFNTSLSAPGVSVLDPATGTGSFIVNILNRIEPGTLAQKYAHDLFANEIMLLPYYIASLNIEHAYYEKMGRYDPFPGICFADTLELADPLAHTGHTQAMIFNEPNTERVEREQAARIMVVIGNPPYNVGQVNENDNNKNRKYDVIDKRVSATYAKDSKATLNTKLHDAYVKFFRWATDRLQGRDGVVCFVSNNGFFEGMAFDGFRKHLLQDFTHIYLLDLKGDAYTSSEQRRKEGGNIFDDKIRVGVSITLLVRSHSLENKGVWYHCVSDYWKADQKREYLRQLGSWSQVEWQPLIVDSNSAWLIEELPPEFADFLPLGTHESRDLDTVEAPMVFSSSCLGVNTARDSWAYNFDQKSLETNIRRFIDTYNGEVDRWKRQASSTTNIDDFVTYDDKSIKWSRDLKRDVRQAYYLTFEEAKIRRALYRPFCKQWLYFDRHIIDTIARFPRILSTPASEAENQVIGVTDLGSEKPFMTLISNSIDDLHLVGAGAGTQCFPFYVYNEDGSGRRENITDWALARFQAAYGPDVTKRDIFAYVYGALHHPGYRERYAANLKRELPRIPLVAGAAAFREIVRIGGALAALHLGYEDAAEYPLAAQYAPGQPVNWRVGEKRMRLSADKTALAYNDWLTLTGIPAEVYRYRLGNRSALEWVIDQYHIGEDSRSKIVSDPNRPDDEQYIVRLIKRVVTVSLETVRLVDALAGVELVDEGVLAGCA